MDIGQILLKKLEVEGELYNLLEGPGQGDKEQADLVIKKLDELKVLVAQFSQDFE